MRDRLVSVLPLVRSTLATFDWPVPAGLAPVMPELLGVRVSTGAALLSSSLVSEAQPATKAAAARTRTRIRVELFIGLTSSVFGKPGAQRPYGPHIGSRTSAVVETNFALILPSSVVVIKTSRP